MPLVICAISSISSGECGFPHGRMAGLCANGSSGGGRRRRRGGPGRCVRRGDTRRRSPGGEEGEFLQSLRKQREGAGGRAPPAAPSVRCRSLMTTSICPHPWRNSSPQENYSPHTRLSALDHTEVEDYSVWRGVPPGSGVISAAVHGLSRGDAALAPAVAGHRERIDNRPPPARLGAMQNETLASCHEARASGPLSLRERVRVRGSFIGVEPNGGISTGSPSPQPSPGGEGEPELTNGRFLSRQSHP